MHHHVARASGRRLLFNTWSEGLELWHCLLRVAPAPIALCIMPNHLHLITPSPVKGALGHALSGFARRWHHRHGTGGELFGRLPAVEHVATREKQRRLHRYVALNPCRAGLTANPLAWPLSTFIDDVGLSIGPVRRRVNDVYRHHAYIVSDERTNRAPLPQADVEAPDLWALTRAISHVTRTPLEHVLDRPGPSRTLAIHCMRTLNDWSARRIASELGVSHPTVLRVGSGDHRDVEIVRRVACDSSLEGLDDLALHRMLAASKYRGFYPPPRKRAFPTPEPRGLHQPGAPSPGP